MKIIITRPAVDAEPFAREVRRAGGEPILSPVMAIRHQALTIDLTGVGAFAFTSANGVRAFAANSPVRTLPVFAVGPTTAAVAAAAGFADVRIAGGDVSTLAALISSSKPPMPVLHLAGSERAGDLVSALGREGVDARRVTLYDAEGIAAMSAEAAAALADRAPETAVALFSPRSARIFAAQATRANLTGRLRKATALCFSDAVAEALDHRGWGAINTVADRTLEAMIDGVSALIGGAGRNGRMTASRSDDDRSL